ncbi:MAG: SNF2-related protein [Nanoarchaeota archaeon]|jgi:SNF2 family DNA or RNA helicase|nr:SNF2-related protein [Nanoarchaeota archaeon]
MVDVTINESFSNEDLSFFEKLEKKEFESSTLLNLKVEAEEISNDTEINELLGYALIEKNLAYKLPYQIDGALRILRDLNGSALLADEVGLGKTITSALVVKECIVRGFAKRILILTPPSLVNQWVAELREKFELDFKIIEKESDWANATFAIASLDRVKMFDRKTGEFRHKKAHQIPWDLLMVDEAHKLKESNTIRWKFVDQLQKKRFLLLTATPFQNDLLELYNLLNLLKKGHLGTVKEFRKQFLNQGNKRHPLNPKQLKAKLDQVMVRRKRSETGIEYKKRMPRIISVEQTEQEAKIYDKIQELLKEQYFYVDGGQINPRLILFAILPKVTSSSKSAMESLAKMAANEKYHEETRRFAREILSDYRDLKVDSKMEKMLEIINETLAENPKEKILIYTKHPSTLEYIKERLEPYKIKVTGFMGGLTREEKAEKIREFKYKSQVLICTDAGAEGLNLQFCSVLINYDLPWNPMSVEQRIGRLDRIGQKKDMQIYSLATKGTMEEHIVDLIINKMCCVGLVVGELPIILFNLGLDSEGKGGSNKIEERILNSFIDSKNNLEKFAKSIKEIETTILAGMEEYDEAKSASSELLDEEDLLKELDEKINEE